MVVVLVVVMAVAASAAAHLGRLQLFHLRPHVILLQEICANIIEDNTVRARNTNSILWYAVWAQHVFPVVQLTHAQ